MTAAPSVYFMLGTPGSGRREIIRDLIDHGCETAEPVLVLLADEEAADPADARLAARAATTVRRWTWTPPDLPDVDLTGASRIFFLAAGRRDPVTQIEALKPWLLRHGAELFRIFCVVDCGFAAQHPPLLQWFTACVHFSDVVFLTHREGVPNKWLSDFIGHFQHQFVPSHFIHFKKGGVPNPALVLEPQSRRLSQYFDEADEFPEVEIGVEDEDGAPVPLADAEGDQPLPEEYFERLRSGRRVKEVPDVNHYLPPRG